MDKIDSHTHTYFSFDGKMEIKDLARQASALGYTYLAVTEHLDCDYLYCDGMQHVKQLDLAAYKKGFKAAAAAVASPDLYFAFGIECGYCTEAAGHYSDLFSKTEFDVIINSVHSFDRKDIYIAAMSVRDKQGFYLRYLEKVLESIKADYPYHIVGHFGYITRYADFSFGDLNNPAADALTEEILKEIILRDKTLEINAKGSSGSFLPARTVLEKYYALGGRDITFSSDAHHLAGLGAGYESVVKQLADIGFDRFTIYIKGEKRFVNFTE